MISTYSYGIYLYLCHLPMPSTYTYAIYLYVLIMIPISLDDVMTIIHSHWKQYPPVNPLIGHFFGIMFFFLWIMSFVGNGCVIYIFLKVKSLRTPVI